MGSEVASQCFIDALNQNGYEVSVVGYMRSDDLFELNQQEILVDKRYIETKRAKFYPILWLILSIVKGLPYSAAKYYSKTYIKTINKILSTKKYDVFIIDHPQLGWLERFIKSPEKVITIAHNIEQEIYQQNYKNAGSLISKLIYKREAHIIKQMEDKLATTSREVWALTEHDSKYFSTLEGVRRVRVFALPPGLAKLQDKPISKVFDIGIIGSWAWKANEEALQWFLQAVYPHLPANLSIHVAGKGAEWLTEKYSNIHYRGFVPDAQEFMAQAKVVAIPTLSGGGIQIKTLDAIASGSAIVATPVALRGISDPPATVQVAEQAEDFAKLLVCAIASPSTQPAFGEALDWYRDRQNKFIADVACAINEL
ncbi:glycosyltransferase family 4 protein [Microcoleus sp. ZQ-A2]